MIPLATFRRRFTIGTTITETIVDTTDYVLHLIGQSNALGRAAQPSGFVNNNGMRSPNGSDVPVPEGTEFGVDEVLADSWPVTQPYLVKGAGSGITVNTWYSAYWNNHITAGQSIPNYAAREHVAVWVIGESDAVNVATEAQYRTDELVVFDALRSAFPGIKILSVLLNPTINVNAEGVANVNSAKRLNAAASDVTVIGGDYSLKTDNLHYDRAGHLQMALDVRAVIAGNYVDRTAPLVDPATLWTPAGKSFTQGIYVVTDGLQDVSEQPIADGINVETWQDQSGLDRHATSTSTTRLPVYTASDASIGNKPSLKMPDGVQNSFIKTPSMTVNRVYIVAQYDPATAQSASTTSYLLAGSAQGQPYIGFRSGYSSWHDLSAFTPLGHVNGAPESSSAFPLPLSVVRFDSSADQTQEWHIGYDFDGVYTGYLFTNGLESEAESTAIVGWLAHKVGSPAALVNGHPYQVSAPTNQNVTDELVTVPEVLSRDDLMPAAITTDSGTWRIALQDEGYKWTLDENPGWESFMAINDTTGFVTKTVGGQSLHMGPHSVRFSQAAAPVAVSAARIRQAIADKRWIPYDPARATAWPVAFNATTDILEQYNAATYNPATMNGTSSTDNIVGVTGGQGGEYHTSRGAIDDPDAHLIAYALANSDATVSGYTDGLYKAAFAFAGFPNRTPCQYNVLRDPQKPVLGKQYEYRVGGSESTDQVDSHIPEGEWTYDNSHNANVGWALWLGTEDPRIGMVVQSHAAFSLATYYEYERIPKLQGNGAQSEYGANHEQERAVYNSLNSLWRARDVARQAPSNDIVLWSEARVNDMYADADAQLAAKMADIDNTSSGNLNTALRVTSSPVPNTFEGGYKNGADADLTYISRATFMDQGYGAVPMYLRALAGEALGIDIMARMARHHVARFHYIGGKKGFNGVFETRGSGYPIGPSAAGVAQLPPFTTLQGWAAWIDSEDIRDSVGALASKTDFNDAPGHYAVQSEFILLAAKDLVTRGILPAVPDLDAAIVSLTAARDASTTVSFGIWHKHCQALSTAA